MLLTLAFLSGLFGGSDDDKKKKEMQKKELNRKRGKKMIYVMMIWLKQKGQLCKNLGMNLNRKLG